MSAGADFPPMPDLSHLSEEERRIIEAVLQKQKEEEDKDENLSKTAQQELEEVERQIKERVDKAHKLIGTQDDAICQICQKTKFASGVGNKCHYCQLRSCARCGGRTQIKTSAPKNDPKSAVQAALKSQPQPQTKTVWACSLCQKKQTILAKTGKWFHGVEPVKTGGTPITTAPSTPSGTNSAQGASDSPLPSSNTRLPASGSDPNRRPPAESNKDRSSANGRVPSGTGLARQPSFPEQKRDGGVSQPPSGKGLRRENSEAGGPPRSDGQGVQRPSGSSFPADSPSGVSGNRRTSREEMRSLPHQGSLRDEDIRRGSRSPTYRDDRDGRRSSSPYRERNGDRDKGYVDERGRKFPPADYDSPTAQTAGRRGPISGSGRPYTPDDRGNRDDRYSPQPYDRQEDRRVDSRRINGSSDDARLNNIPRVNPPTNGVKPTDSSKDPRYDSRSDRDLYNDRADPAYRRSGQSEVVDNRYNPDGTRPIGPTKPRIHADDVRDQRLTESGTYDYGRRSDKPGVRPIATEPIRNVPEPDYSPPTDSGSSVRKPYGGDLPPRHIDSRSPERRISAPPDNISSSSRRGIDERTSPPDRTTKGTRDRDYNSATYDRYSSSQPPTASSMASRDGYVERNGKDTSGSEYLDRTARAPSPSHRISAASTAPIPMRRAKLDTGGWRGDSQSSEQSEVINARAALTNHHHPPSKHHKHKRANAKPHRQHRSPSSSEEEIRSTPECTSCEEQEMESENFSEKGDLAKRRLQDESHKGKRHPNSSQTPVTWQPNADGSLMIGHMILLKQSGSRSSGDVLGLKVVGGKRTESGRLGAFVTKVKRGSVADTVGHLKPGDEVLEWNCRPLQNATSEQVCDIISESKYDSQVELIVARPTLVHDGKLDSVKPPPKYAEPVNELMPQMVVDPNIVYQQPYPIGLMPAAANPLSVVQSAGGAPIVMVTGPPDPNLGTIQMGPLAAVPTSTSARGQIFGQIQIAIYYDPLECQLMVTVIEAVDLAPRNEGSGRNPYVKMFLLPDRSEKSKRKSKTLASTTHPIWQQRFLYPGLRKRDLAGRILEITLWDYDRYATNDFLGEVLLDLALTPLDNQPRWYTLADMDDDVSQRTRLRMQRLNSFVSQEYLGPGTSGLSNSYMDSSFDDVEYPDPRRQPRSGSAHSGYRSDSGVIDRTAAMPRSRTFNRPRHPQAVNQDDLQPFEMGYFSDHQGHRSRTSKSVGNFAQFNINGGPTASHSFQQTSGSRIRPTSPLDGRDVTMDPSGKRRLPQIPSDLYGEEAMRELGDKVIQLKSRGFIQPHSAHSHHGRRAGHRSRFANPNSPPQDGLPGYQSDGSEVSSMSITSTKSERPRTKTAQEFQNSLETATEENEYVDEGQDGTMSDSAVGGSVATPARRSEAEAKRRKSIMTRLIPGRANSAQNVNEAKKRTGFTRSEEVGIPTASLSPGASQPRLNQQMSFDSSFGSVSSCHSDTNSSWIPGIPPSDGLLGDFVKDLGPGQIAGRQVLASPVMGEIQLSLLDNRGALEVEVIRAKGLIPKPGSKLLPAPYVKVYLHDGKYCTAKAKTSISRRTLEPYFQQQLVFAEDYRGKILQVAIWGDYGRMERKVFMGIVQIQLDLLNLPQEPVMNAWYKFFHSSSVHGLVSSAGSPGRVKDGQMADGTNYSGGGQ